MRLGGMAAPLSMLNFLLMLWPDGRFFEEYAAIMQYDGRMTREEAETQAREAKMLDDLLNLPPFDLKDLPEPALDDLLKDLLILPELPELPPFV